jgi:hypothetical protein
VKTIQGILYFGERCSIFDLRDVEELLHGCLFVQQIFKGSEAPFRCAPYKLCLCRPVQSGKYLESSDPGKRLRREAAAG